MDSEKELFEDLSSKKNLKEEKQNKTKETFKDQPGTPANENFKRLAREKSAASKKDEKSEEMYSMNNGKLLRIMKRKTGTYSVFVSKLTKKNKAVLTEKIKEYKQKGMWLEPHQLFNKELNLE